MQKPVALPLAITLLLHAVIILALALNLSFFSEPKVIPPQPQIIQAQLVSLEALPALRATPKPVTEAPPAPVAEPKPEPVKPEPDKPIPPKPELKPPEPIKPPQPAPPPKPDPAKQQEAERKQQEKEKQIQLQKEKAEKEKQAEVQKQKDLEKQKAEQKKQEAERKRKEELAEAQRKKQQEDAQRKQREQQEKAELAKAMAAEDNAMAAERDQEAVASYIGLITRDITNNWSRPPNARHDMQVTLLIQLIPSGDVINVSVAKSSGDSAFDRSAEMAVRRVGKFPYLKELPNAAFEKNFRRLQMRFTPEDLRQ